MTKRRQHGTQTADRFQVVVDHQHAATRARRGRKRAFAFAATQRKIDGERGPESRAIARRSYTSPVQLDQPLDHGKTKPQAAQGTGQRSIALNERLENAWQKIGLDAGTGIEPEIRLPLGEALREIGHRVALAADGDEAMHCLDRQTFNLVVSDIRLPKGDGFSILRQVRDQQPNTDVILMTAFGTIQEAVSAVRETAIEYLTKPSRYPRFWPWSGASTSTGAS